MVYLLKIFIFYLKYISPSTFELQPQIFMKHSYRIKTILNS